MDTLLNTSVRTNEDLNYDNYLLKLPKTKYRKIHLGINDKCGKIGKYINEDYKTLFLRHYRVDLLARVAQNDMQKETAWNSKWH